MRTMPTQDTDIDALTEAELLALPESLIPAGSLTAYWSLHASAVEKENADELIRERSGASRSRRMVGTEPTEEDREREQQRHYEQALRDVRAREDTLLIRIEQQERQIATRQQEIEENAIRLHDGRLVYVDGRKYRDGQGRVLEGDDEIEARRQHRDKPNASTWRQKTDADKQWAETERIRREIEERRRAEGQGSPAQQEANIRARQDALGGYEKVLQPTPKRAKPRPKPARMKAPMARIIRAWRTSALGPSPGRWMAAGRGSAGNSPAALFPGRRSIHPETDGSANRDGAHKAGPVLAVEKFHGFSATDSFDSTYHES